MAWKGGGFGGKGMSGKSWGKAAWGDASGAWGMPPAMAAKAFGKGGKWGPPGYVEPEVPVLWIELHGKSRLTQDGYPEIAPVIQYEKSKEVLASSAYILSEFIGDVTTQVAFDHDPDWQVFPEVAKAIKQAGGHEDCICVATCASQGKWAVGMSGGWKNRESAARLALSVAIAAHSPKLLKVASEYQGFATLCAASGILPGGAAAVFDGFGGGSQDDGWGASSSSKKNKKKKKPTQPTELGEGEGAIAGLEGALSLGLPKEPVETDFAPLVWMILEEESRVTSEGFPPDAPAMSHDKTQDVFKVAHHVLQDLVEDIAAEVQFTHDADWEIFPEVSRAIQKAGGEENCVVVATCPKHAKWAVGIASGWKNRESAAKVALALAIGKDMAGSLEKLSDTYPDFGEICHEQGLISSPPTKRKAEDFGAEAYNPEEPVQKRGKGGQAWYTIGKGTSKGGSGQANGKGLPLEAPRWLQINPLDPMPVTIEDLPREALVLNSNGTGRRGVYNCIDQVLTNFGLDPNGGSDIEYVDDPNWDVLPELGKALKEITDEEQCLHVAICRALGVYGCGLSSKWKNRNAAAKVSLALLLVMRAGEGGEKPDLSDYPAFAKVLEEVPASPPMF